jgi:hypothetical protein
MSVPVANDTERSDNDMNMLVHGCENKPEQVFKQDISLQRCFQNRSWLRVFWLPAYCVLFALLAVATFGSSLLLVGSYDGGLIFVTTNLVHVWEFFPTAGL